MKSVLIPLFNKSKLKIGIVGGCQVEGIREASLKLFPGAAISAWHAGVNPPDAPQDIVKKLKQYDFVVSQVTPGHGLEVLEIDALKSELPNVYFMPTVAFSGLHPDTMYLFSEAGLIKAVHSDFHSKIAVAGFLMGLTPERTHQLYNTLVFQELEYFDAFPAAKIALEQRLSSEGFAVDGLVEAWLNDIGPFMYMPNHPHIQVIATLCCMLYKNAGLIPDAVRVPHVEKDHLSESFTWPVYPALAKRLGATGSMNFHRPAWLVSPRESRDLPVLQYLRDLFEYYSTVDVKLLKSSDVADACEKIGKILK